jgi:hypothetical protein
LICMIFQKRTGVMHLRFGVTRIIICRMPEMVGSAHADRSRILGSLQKSPQIQCIFTFVLGRCTLENRKVHPWINVRALELALFGTLPRTRKLCGRILNRDAHLWDRGSVQPSPGWLQDIQGLPAQVRFGLSRASSLMTPHAICYNLRVTA